MAYCTSCGTGVSAADRFCHHCGAAQPEAGAAAPSAAPAATPPKNTRVVAGFVGIVVGAAIFGTLLGLAWHFGDDRKDGPGSGGYWLQKQ